jgi:ribosomal protein S12 methylthiotransferase accessory factor
VTGLDRTGVEVACAVRPRAHVLQVTNGKGESAQAAEIGAILEAAELWASESVDPAALVYASRRELLERGDDAWDAGDLGSAGRLVAPGLWSDETRLAWRAGTELTTGREVLVPAQAVHCPPPGGPPLGPAVVAWTTNGMGAHPRREAALRHALLEAIERDQLARALPEGWTERAIATRLLHATAPSPAFERARVIVERRFEVFLFDLTPSEESLSVPVAGALLFDADDGPVPLTAGYACATDPDAALLAALLEAAQSRLTDIHGAREDVVPAGREEVARLRKACRAARPARRVESMPRVHGARTASVLDGLQARRCRVAVFDLAPDAGLVHVIKVVVPGFEVSELL